MSANLFGAMDDVVVACCAILVVLCFAGLYSKLFRDNWFQTIGMSFIMLGSMVVGYNAWHTQFSTWRGAMFVIGITLFACGTAWKTWNYRHSRHDQPTAPPPTPPSPTTATEADSSEDRTNLDDGAARSQLARAWSK